MGEIASRYQLHTVHCTFARSFNEHPNSLKLKSAYLDFQHFHRRSSKFPAEHLFSVVGMIYSLLYRHNSACTVFWVSSFHLKGQCPDYAHARASSVFSSKDNRPVKLTRQDFLPDRTADGDLLFIFPGNILDFRRNLSSYLKFGSRQEDSSPFYR